VKRQLIVHGLIKKEGKFLATKRGRVEAFPNYWDLPGGKVEDREFLKKALIREVKEEVGLDVTVNEILYEFTNYDEIKDIYFTTLFYLCDLKDMNQKIILDLQEHLEYKWINDMSEIDGDFVFNIKDFLSDINIETL